MVKNSATAMRSYGPTWSHVLFLQLKILYLDIYYVRFWSKVSLLSEVLDVKTQHNLIVDKIIKF